jgi:exonuclease III
MGAMIAIGWNCHGMKLLGVIRTLQNVVRQIKLDVVFMSELHLDKPMAEKLMRKMKFYKLSGHESYGGSGDLIIMWKKEIKIQAKRVERVLLMYNY